MLEHYIDVKMFNYQDIHLFTRILKYKFLKKKTHTLNRRKVLVGGNKKMHQELIKQIFGQTATTKHYYRKDIKNNSFTLMRSTLKYNYYVCLFV